MATNINATIEALRLALVEIAGRSADCCQGKGGKTGAGPSTQAPEYGGIDDKYPTAEDFFDARCNASNGVYDTILGAVTWLDDNSVDWKAGLFGGLTTGLIFGLLGAGPAGWAIVVAGTIVTSLTVWLIRESFDFADLATALGDVQDELVVSLYNAGSISTARQNFLSILEGATPAPSSAELTLIEIMLGDDLLNNVLDPREDMAEYQSPSPVDCGSFVLLTWTFPADAQGWTFRDDSAGASSASGVYNGPDEALEVTMNNAGGGSKPIAKGTWLKTGLSQAVTIGGSVQFDYSEPSDGINQGGHIWVKYSDLTTNTRTLALGTSAGTMIMTFPADKTVSEIECSLSRTTSSTNSHTADIEEVRVQ